MDKLILKTLDFAKSKLQAFDGGHDWSHTERVWKLAKHIYQEEKKGDILVIEMSALLHDIADSKFHDSPESLGGDLAFDFMLEQGVSNENATHVKNIINHISFKNRLTGKTFTSAEYEIVQDADRIDAIGAIGIARAFNNGGFKNRALHDPEIPVQQYSTQEEYKKSPAPTINHFHEKLFLLKDLMNTKTGKAMAEKRHEYMEEFVKRFLEEWEGDV